MLLAEASEYFTIKTPAVSRYYSLYCVCVLRGLCKGNLNVYIVIPVYVCVSSTCCIRCICKDRGYRLSVAQSECAHCFTFFQENSKVQSRTKSHLNSPKSTTRRLRTMQSCQQELNTRNKSMAEKPQVAQTPLENLENKQRSSAGLP